MLDNIDQQRRDWLIKALTRGLFLAGASGISLPAWAMAQRPQALSAGKSVYRLDGEVVVDGKPATLETVITSSSVIETSANSKIIFVVGKDAFILRDSSRLELRGMDFLIQGLRVLNGRLLSVFGKRTRQQELNIDTTVAAIGIRGTGLYLEAEDHQTYVCTCYGNTELVAMSDNTSREIITTSHHESPRYIFADAPEGKKIQEAPVINHTDNELDLIEALVGRTTPFIPDEY